LISPTLPGLIHIVIIKSIHMNELFKPATTGFPPEEMNDHYSVLEDFFSCFHLQDIREMLWEWLVAALSSDSGAYSSGYARSNLIYVYEKLLTLIEATYEIKKRRKKKPRRKLRNLQFRRGNNPHCVN
jgi:hypothetical protein